MSSPVLVEGVSNASGDNPPEGRLFRDVHDREPIAIGQAFLGPRRFARESPDTITFMEISKGAVPHRTVAPREGEAENLDSDRLVPQLYTTRTAMSDVEGQYLRCAACGSITVSPTHVETYRSDYDELSTGVRVETGTGKSTPVSSNEALRSEFAPRGTTTGVFFRCELGHAFVLELANHKGLTWAATYSWADGDESWWRG